MVQQLTFYWRFYRVVDMTLNRRTFDVIVCYTVYFEELVEKLDDRLKLVRSDLFQSLTITENSSTDKKKYLIIKKTRWESWNVKVYNNHTSYKDENFSFIH